MKLILLRDQKSGFTGSTTFSITVQAEITEEEREHIARYKMGKTLLYTNMEDRGSGVLGAVSRKMIGTEITIDDLVKGKTVEYKDILEMIAFEKQVIVASEVFKEILDAMATFGGEDVIEI